LKKTRHPTGFFSIVFHWCIPCAERKSRLWPSLRRGVI
jgi:hypothetical protein